LLEDVITKDKNVRLRSFKRARKKPSIFAAAKFVILISGIHQEKIMILK